MKKRLFIGSSAEQLATLNEIIKLIGDDVECIPWTGAFEMNKSGLDSLIKQTRLSDFAILLATKDDLTKQRGENLSTPRDNVIFEFGLFLGASGSDKCYLVAEADTNLPSDLDGITVSKFTREVDKYNSLDKIVEDIKKHINKAEDVSALGLLPSTALAIGYYNSFIKRVCEELHRTESINTESANVKIKSFKIKVIIPQKLDDDGVVNFAMLYNKKHGLNKASTALEATTQGRGYPFHFKIDPPSTHPDNPIEIHISDVPGTLSTIVECLKLYLPATDVGPDFNMSYLEKRELDNFTKVLNFLIKKNTVTNTFVEVETDVAIN
jgi:hypothetical protein